MRNERTEHVEPVHLEPMEPPVDAEVVADRWRGAGIVLGSLLAVPLFFTIVFAAVGWAATAFHWMKAAFAG